MDWLIKGGWVMAALVPCSIISLAIFIERMIYLNYTTRKSSVIINRIQLGETKQDLDSLLKLCQSSDTPIARIIEVALKNSSKPRNEIEKSLEDAAKIEVPKLERFLNVLLTIAGISPMLGFLGTVTGMIRSFNVMAIQGTGNPAALAGGISEALITTATGLIIAIPTHIAYNYLVSRVNRIITETEVAASKLIESFSSVSSVKQWTKI